MPGFAMLRQPRGLPLERERLAQSTDPAARAQLLPARRRRGWEEERVGQWLVRDQGPPAGPPHALERQPVADHRRFP